MLQQQETGPANPWLAVRHHYHIRRLYTLFADFNTGLFSADLPLQELSVALKSGGQLRTLRTLSADLFGKESQQSIYGHHLNWAMQALFHASIKLHASLKMADFHHQNQSRDQNDPGHTAFIDGLDGERTEQLTAIRLLVDNIRNLLRLMLIEQTGNDLLLRLFIEKAEFGQGLWGATIMDLFAEMFPGQPETGYVQAGKSYFMGQWLEEALTCYEKSLELNTTLSEPRRQTYLIKAMIADRDESGRNKGEFAKPL
jgi:hypothetical protein